MVCVYLYILFGALQCSFSQSEAIWNLVVKPSRNSGNVTSEMVWKLSTPTRLSCAALCLRKGNCSFYGYQDHVCHGNTTSGTRLPPSNVPTIMQGHFRRYKRKVVLGGYKRLSSGSTSLYVKVHNYEKCHAEALQVCQAEDATLVKLDSRQKVTLFFRGLNHKPFEMERYWIGLSDRYDNNTWYWTDGTDLSRYNNWGFEEPHTYRHGLPENCAGIIVHIFNNGKWFDGPCNARQKFVCEKV